MVRDLTVQTHLGLN